MEVQWPEVMNIYPDPRKLREMSLSKGTQVADEELQKAMVESARLKVEKNITDLESKEMYDATSYGQIWIADNIKFIAEVLISSPTNEIVKSFIGFPDKLSAKGENVSCSDYIKDKSSYRAKGIRYVKPKEGQNLSREQLKINEFVFGVGAAKQRAMTVAFIVLTELLSSSFGDSNKISKKEGKGSKKSLTAVAGHIINNVLNQLLILKGKDLKEVMEIPSVRSVVSLKGLTNSKGQLNVKGKKVLKILGVKSVNSISEKGLLTEGQTLINLIGDVLDDVTVFDGEVLFTDDIKEKLNDCRLRTLSGANEARPVLSKPYCNGRTTAYNEAPLRRPLVNTWQGESLVSEMDQIAIDRIQGTAFSINNNVLKVAKQVVEHNLLIKKKMCLEVLPDLDPLDDFPKRGDLSREEYNILKRDWFSVDKNKDRYAKWKDTREKREKLQSRSFSVNDMNLRTLEIAEWYSAYGGAFYLPCYLDYRSRVYYCPTILNPQSSKLSKALFVANRGKAIGSEEALDYWLVNFAGAMSNVTLRDGSVKKDGDKTSWNDAVFVGRNELEQGAKVAADPIGTFDYWSKMDDPFAYLAHAFECQGVLDEGVDFVSKIFISMDGSCNAYQHAAGYLKDRATAELVNLTYRSDDTEPADMYGTVAEYYLKNLDKQERFSQLATFHSLINRGSCKRIVMTLGYGLTQGGAKKYGMEEIEEYSDDYDNNPFDVFGRREAADEFALGVWGSVASCAPAVIRVKEGLSLIGRLVAEHSKDGIVRWTTYTGTKVAYTKYREKKSTVRKQVGNKVLKFTMLEKTNDISPDEVANAAAPNYTHSRDADHIRLAVLGMPEDCSFLMIHDSFGTLAADAPQFNKVIKETFVELYETGEPLREFFNENMPEVLAKLNIGVNVGNISIELLENFLELSKEKEKKDRQAEAWKRKVCRDLIKVLEYIEITGDMDFEEVRTSRYSFR